VSHGSPLDPAETSELDAHLSRRGMRIRAVRDVFEIIAFSAAGVWAIWTFWYQASYEPAHEKPLIVWNLTLEREAVRPSDGLLAIRAHAVGSNKGKATEHLVSLVVNLYGGHVRRLDPEPLTLDAGASSWDINPRFRAKDGVFLASQGQRWGEAFRAFVHPDQDFGVDFHFWIDPADYDVLAAELEVRDETDESFAGSHYAARLVDGGAGGVEVVGTEQCLEPGVHCTHSVYVTEAEMTLWPTERGGDEHVRRSSSATTLGDGGTP
jgi:hypothetical protein